MVPQGTVAGFSYGIVSQKLPGVKLNQTRKPCFLEHGQWECGATKRFAAPDTTRLYPYILRVANYLKINLASSNLTITFKPSSM